MPPAGFHLPPWIVLLGKASKRMCGETVSRRIDAYVASCSYQAMTTQMAGFVDAPGTASNGAGKRLCHWKGVVLHHLFPQLAVESPSFYNPGCPAPACGEQGAMKAKPEGVRTTKAPPGGSGVTTSTWPALWELESDMSDEPYHW